MIMCTKCKNAQCSTNTEVLSTLTNDVIVDFEFSLLGSVIAFMFVFHCVRYRNP